MKLLIALVLIFGVGLALCATNGRASIPQDRAKTWRVISHIFPRAAAPKAFRVTGCETGGKYNRDAYNKKYGYTGIFQFDRGWIGKLIRWGKRAIRVRNNLHGRYPSARYALFLSKGGTDWSHWPTCGRR
jgi:hypothetical protein